jgi:hypothetical protein
MTPDTTRLLDELGLAVGPLGTQLIDASAADGYIHHSRAPVALVGYALTVPAIARDRFPKFTFVALVQKAHQLDLPEKAALAALCGAHETRRWHDPAAFGQQVWQVVDKYDLHPFFTRIEVPYGSGGEHYYLRPRGIDERTSDPIDAEIQEWRSAYRTASPLRQLMAATVLQLYKQGEDKHWMVRVKKDWHASEGIGILRAEGALEDWGRLYALYSGW